MDQNFKEIISKITKIRQQLHLYPELSYKEFETTKLIKKTLEDWGITFHPFKNLETGGFAEVGSGQTLLYRSDIDALPIIENSSNLYTSRNEGVMHACGHDFHTAFGLGLLRYFQLNPEKLEGKLRVIFQPAEEAAPGGASLVVEEDIWQDVKGILGIHVNSFDPVGVFSLSKTIANASTTSLSIKLNGPGGHTSRPDQSVDLILTSSEYVTQLHSYIKNKVDPRDTVSFSFGRICGGKAHNAIPQSIELQGTLRTHSNEVLSQTRTLINTFSENFSRLHDMKIEIKFPTSCPIVSNDESMVEKFINYYSENADIPLAIIPKPYMGADDFAYFLDKVPGLYVRVGGAGKGVAHTGEFVVNEKIIEPAMEHLVGYIEYFFKH